ncbi:MAG: metalloregulator ArsR/SmtB family transcription factor [Pseudoxanthomonas sp.]|jgi:ArsR family transcriptional regulator|nr:MAG: metalloregulator ArsR/SmtB family transcription factor [Pseudoxanthomonas sp.]
MKLIDPVSLAAGPRAAADVERMQVLADVFRLLGENSRLRIALFCLDRPRAVTEISEGLGLGISLVSHHLRLLRAARLLRAERRGRQVMYLTADEHVRCVLLDMIDHVGEPAETMEMPE